EVELAVAHARVDRERRFATRQILTFESNAPLIGLSRRELVLNVEVVRVERRREAVAEVILHRGVRIPAVEVDDVEVHRLPADRTRDRPAVAWIPLTTRADAEAVARDADVHRLI